MEIKKITVGGIIDTYDPDNKTFCGAYREAIKRLQQGMPNAKIYASGMIYGNNSSYGDLAMYNIRKLYNDAAKLICASMGVPYNDKLERGNIGMYNFRTKLADLIHPNAATYEEIGLNDASFLENN